MARGRFAVAVLLAAAVATPVLAPMSALPAAPLQAPLQPPATPPEPPKELKRPTARTDLDRLFGLLKRAPDKDTAKLIEARIWGQWFHSGSDTTDLLMTRVRVAMEANDNDVALQLLDALVEIRPDYIEAWNRRATLYFMRKDYGGALHDIAETLAREPRHFGALVGLGLILQDIGQDKRALQAFRQALELNPHLERVPDLIKALVPKVDGREI